MAKRLIAAILVIFFTFGIAGCGPTEQKQNVTTPSQTTAAPSAVTEAAANAPVIAPEPDSSSEQVSSTSPAAVNVPAGEEGIAKAHDFIYDGTKRSYMLYIPRDIREGAPLVFVLHGYLDFAVSFMNTTGMNDIADKYGFGVVYPQGLPSKSSEFPGTHWNADFTFTNVDDVGFLTALAGYLQENYGFSSSETFAAGLSNGGFMCYTLAVESPGTFRAIASVAGTMSKGTWDDRDKSAPVPVLQIDGTADKTVPIDGTMLLDGGWGGAPKMDDIIQYWADKDSASTKIQEKSGTITARVYSSSNNKNLVWYYLIDNFGHKWPAIQNSELDTGELIWRFFSNYLD